MSDTNSQLREISLKSPDRRRLSPKSVAGHSKLVKRLRLIVPALGAGVIITYALSATPPTIDRQFLREFENIDPNEEALRLNHPRHVGYDLEGRPFEIAASVATRDPNRPELVSLENPEALRGLDDQESVKVRALRGQMNTATRSLNLTERVELDHQLGGSTITLNTEAAEVDFENNIITSVAGVSGAGESGTVDADKMTVYQEEGRAVLEGNVRLQLTPRSRNDDESDGQDEL